MAMRGGVAAAAAAIACNAISRQTGHHHQSVLSLPRYLRQGFNNNASSVQRFASLPGRGRPIRAVNEATVDRVSNKMEEEEQRPDQDWKIKMLYDGDCPLCMREVNMLKERNKSYGTIKFVDISSDQYSPEENQGLDYETVMGRIHAILADGTVVTDVEAFRRLYENVGLGWVYAITKYEPIASIADALYGVWAKYRLPITGRPTLEQVLETRKKNKDELCKEKDACKM